MDYGLRPPQPVCQIRADHIYGFCSSDTGYAPCFHRIPFPATPLPFGQPFLLSGRPEHPPARECALTGAHKKIWVSCLVRKQGQSWQAQPRPPSFTPFVPNRYEWGPRGLMATFPLAVGRKNTTHARVSCLCCFGSLLTQPDTHIKKSRRKFPPALQCNCHPSHGQFTSLTRAPGSRVWSSSIPLRTASLSRRSSGTPFS